MTPLIVRDVSLAAGLAMVSIGAGMQWGLPFGLMTAGALIVALTVFTYGRIA